jgi:2-dehydropantoate 2-reductase
MRIAVMGAGAVGGYFGGRLAQAGEEVVFIARGATVAALRRDGLRVESIKGDFTIQPAEATDDPATVGPVDAVLVAVKAWQVSEAAAQLPPLIGPDTFVVPLQNGVEAPSQIAAVVGRQHVLGGLCQIICQIVAPGHIRHSGAEPAIAFGELDSPPSERVERLRLAFARATGLTVTTPADIQAAMWQKFLLIASFSGVGAITRAPMGVLRELPECRQLLDEALREGLAVAQARGIHLDDGALAQVWRFYEALPPGATASMQRDIMAGRPSELESQNGAVVRLGAEAGVPTPVHSFLYRALLPQEREARLPEAKQAAT